MSKLSYVVKNDIKDPMSSFSILKSENINNVLEYMKSEKYEWASVVGVNPILAPFPTTEKSGYYLFKQGIGCENNKETPCLIIKSGTLNEAFDIAGQFGFERPIAFVDGEYKVIDVENEMAGDYGYMATVNTKDIKASYVAILISKDIKGMVFKDLWSAEMYISKKYKRISFRKEADILYLYEEGKRILTIKMKRL